MCSPGRSNGFEREPVGADFASGSALTLAPRLTVADRGLPQKSVGIEAGCQRFGASRFCAPFNSPSTFFAKQKTNLILCPEKVAVVAIEASA